jgi:SIR2-like domain
MKSKDNFNFEDTGTIPLPKSIPLPKNNSELMLFLGAGASVPAKIPGVEKMVELFLKYLVDEHYSKHLNVIKDIVSILNDWTNKKDRKVDIELLLEAIEKLENRDDDTLPLFYENKKEIIQKIDDLYLNTDEKILVSDIVKRFIKSETGKVDIEVDYLNGLLELMEYHKPLDIFSTNYDVCIERFCNLNKKRYFDGFEEEWNPEKFKDQQKDKDILLYKLHGSVTWSRSEKGKYTRNEIAIKNNDPQINIVTNEKEIPLILYPGKNRVL